MTESLLSFMEAPGPGLFWILLIFAVSVVLLVEVEYRRTGQRRRNVWRAFAIAMRSGFRSGMRGYFAPFCKAPWLAAWRAYRDPAARWWSPLAAWVDTIERIAFGPAQSSNRDVERNEPLD